MITEHLHLAKANETALTEFEKAQSPFFVVNKEISAESIKAYQDDLLCKPGSSRGCVASLIESKDPEATHLQIATFTARFMPLLVAG